MTKRRLIIPGLAVVTALAAAGYVVSQRGARLEDACAATLKAANDEVFYTRAAVDRDLRALKAMNSHFSTRVEDIYDLLFSSVDKITEAQHRVEVLLEDFYFDRIKEFFVGTVGSTYPINVEDRLKVISKYNFANPTTESLLNKLAQVNKNNPTWTNEVAEVFTGLKGGKDIAKRENWVDVVGALLEMSPEALKNSFVDANPFLKDASLWLSAGRAAVALGINDLTGGANTWLVNWLTTLSEQDLKSLANTATLLKSDLSRWKAAEAAAAEITTCKDETSWQVSLQRQRLIAAGGGNYNNLIPIHLNIFQKRHSNPCGSPFFPTGCSCTPPAVLNEAEALMIETSSHKDVCWTRSSQPTDHTLHATSPIPPDKNYKQLFGGSTDFVYTLVDIAPGPPVVESIPGGINSRGQVAAYLHSLDQKGSKGPSISTNNSMLQRASMPSIYAWTQAEADERFAQKLDYISWSGVGFWGNRLGGGYVSINDLGHTAGTVAVTNNKTYSAKTFAYVSGEAGQLRLLPPNYAWNLGPDNQMYAATALNNSDTVVGCATAARDSLVLQPVIFSKTGVILLTPGRRGCATGINDTGDVVGVFATGALNADGSGSPHAFIYRNGTIRDFGVVDELTLSKAIGISNEGVALWVAEDLRHRSFLDSYGVKTEIVPPGLNICRKYDDNGSFYAPPDSKDREKRCALNVSADAISPTGTVVGEWGSNLEGERAHRFIWSHGVFREFSIIGKDGTPIEESVQLLAINARGQITGSIANKGVILNPR